jgi:hypothetical protein
MTCQPLGIPRHGTPGGSSSKIKTSSSSTERMPTTVAETRVPRHPHGWPPAEHADGELGLYYGNSIGT